ncbi:hypothetical protein MNBD_ALPHA06-10 [hydrothermal vent metagenome]|uniref:Uncharacterized protein n=1 Tax=hydrothermal vent metagenome TaxID=652676 RepID=A0A3B0R3J4_9ZZZZ
MHKLRHQLQIQLALLWSRVSLWVEQSLLLVFPAIVFPALFVALALAGVFEQTGDPWRLVLAALALGGFGFFFWRAVQQANWPTSKNIKRRAETDAGLATGALSALSDEPAGEQNPTSNAFWQAHQQKLNQQTRTLRLQPIRSILAAKDVWALRVLMVLAIFTGAVLAGPAWQARLQNAFTPGILSNSGQAVTVEAWLNPPEYSGLPPVFFVAEQTKQIRALAGSEFVLRVTGSKKPPKLRVSGDTVLRQKLQKTGDGVFEARVKLSGNSQLVLSGSAKGAWQFQAQTDQPPNISFAGQPKVNETDELVFTVLAEDDFGVEQVRLLIRADETGFFEPASELELVLPKTRTLENEQVLDLTRHILAGLPVQLVLQASDGAGQISRSQPVSMLLPQKLFIQPLAKAVVEQRLLVMRDTREYAPASKLTEPAIFLQGDILFDERPSARISLAPAGVQRSAALLRGVMRAPETGIRDALVWLGLSYVRERLVKAKGQADLSELGEVMWQIALHAEGGELESAAAAMKLAEKALQNGLLLEAPPSELQRLSQKYERAVKRYLQALAKQALQADEDGGAGMSMSNDQLQQMLDALQAMSETGATGDARALLKALAQLLQNMKMQMAQGGQGEADDLVAEAMRDALEELGEMLGKQRELLDEAQQQQNADGAPQSPGNMGEMSQRQGQLQGDLNELGQSGTVQSSQSLQTLSEAETAMGEAAKALGEEDADAALIAGQKAFNQLREGAETLADEMLARQEGAKKGQNDPFGRKNNGGMQSAEGTEIPDLIEPQQARKILQELRRRAADQQRPRQELEYLDRLLDRF